MKIIAPIETGTPGANTPVAAQEEQANMKKLPSTGELQVHLDLWG